MGIGEKLEMILKDKRMSAPELGRLIGQERPETIYKILQGKSKPNFGTLEAILKAFPDVNANYLFGTEENVYRNQVSDKQGLKDAIEILKGHL